MNKTLKTIYAIAVFCAYVLGAIGSIGWTFFSHAWLIGVGSIAVAAMALPYVLRVIKDAGIL